MTEQLKSPYWIQTYTKGTYDFYYNNPDDINIVDIAHSLAQKPRFGGHLNYQFSIAQHSLMVAAVMERVGLSNGSKKYPKKVLLQALMHDAHEAYIPDFTRPFDAYLKEVCNFDVTPIKQQIDVAISERFGIDLINKHPDIDKFDDYVMRTEAEDLWDRVVNEWTDSIDQRCKDRILRENIIPFPTAKMLFIKTFKRYGGKV